MSNTNIVLNNKLNIKIIQALFPKYILNISKLNYLKREQIQCVVPLQNIEKLMSILFLHYNFQYKSLIDLLGVDYLSRHYRFQLIYQLISYNYASRLFIKVWTNETTAVPSITSIYPSINWYERECWDMYGISFYNHPDLRRILTDYGFQGHPFRKDFPLSGFVELRYDERYQRICYEPVQSIQEFRVFDTLTPWDFFKPSHGKIHNK